jgi:hypothetical protein
MFKRTHTCVPLEMEPPFTEKTLGLDLAEGAALRTRLELLDIKMYHAFPYWAKPPDAIKRMAGEEAAVERYVAWCEIWVAMAEAYESTVSSGDINLQMTTRAITIRQYALWSALNMRASDEVTQHSVAAREHARWLTQWTEYAETEMRHLCSHIDDLLPDSYLVPHGAAYRSLEGLHGPCAAERTSNLALIKHDLAELEGRLGQLGQRYPDRGARRAYTDRPTKADRSSGRAGWPKDTDAPVVDAEEPSPLTGSLFQIIAKRGHHAYREIGRVREEYDAWRQAGGPEITPTFTREGLGIGIIEDARRRVSLEFFDIKMHNAFPFWARPPGDIEDIRDINGNKDTTGEEAAVERYVAWCGIWVAMAEAYGSTFGTVDRRDVLLPSVNPRMRAEVTRHSVDAREYSQRLEQWMSYARDEMYALIGYIQYLLDCHYRSIEEVQGPTEFESTAAPERIRRHLDTLKVQLTQQGRRYPGPRTRRAHKLLLAEIGRSFDEIGRSFKFADIPKDLDALVADYAEQSPLTGSLFQILADRGHFAYYEIGEMQTEYDAWKLERTRPTDGDGGGSRGKARGPFASTRSEDDDGEMSE